MKTCNVLTDIKQAQGKFGGNLHINNQYLHLPMNHLRPIVRETIQKSRFIMKVQAFCEEKGLMSLLGVFGYAE